MLQAAKKVTASRLAKMKTSAAKGVAPAENRRNSKRLSGDSNVYETTNSRGMNQAQITAEQLRFQEEEEAEKNKDPNANKDTDHNIDEQSEGTQSEDDNPSDNSSEEETLEELFAKAKTSRRNSTLRGLAILYAQGDNLTLDCEEIIALQLSNGELKTLMKRYATNPQKSESLP
jgi:hypothetical protein